jgi:hypothetical protein
MITTKAYRYFYFYFFYYFIGGAGNAFVNR